MTEDPLDPDLREAIRELARTPNLLVGTDFDGTLAPIVGHPPDARALPRSLVSLRDLADLPATTVAVVSGRSVADLAGLSGLPLVSSPGPSSPGAPPHATAIRLVGNHGSQFDTDVDAAMDLDASRRLAALTDAIRGATDGVPGVLLEDKPTGVAVHVRNASRPDAAVVLDAIRMGAGAMDGVHVMEGKEVIELSLVDTDKGMALDVLRRECGATATLFIGDDVTDERAFERLVDGDLGVKVGPGATSAAYRIGDPVDVGTLLAELVRERSAWLVGGGRTTS